MHTLMATSAQKCLLPVDAHGAPVLDALAGLGDHDAAAAAREAVDALLCVRCSVVAAVSTPDDGAPGAVVTVREVTESGVAYHTATATGASGGEAVGRAVLQAFGVDGSFVDPAAERWARAAGVRSTTVMRGDDLASYGPADDAQLHCQLVQTMPAAGSLAVDTADAAYRVVRLPSVAVACTLVPHSRALMRFDEWAHVLQGRCRC
jgi:hypothetical protein